MDTERWTPIPEVACSSHARDIMDITKDYGSKKIVFRKRPMDDWSYTVFVSEGNKKQSIPLLLDKDQINIVVKRLNSIKRTDLEFDLFCMVVAGCISICLKNKDS